MYKRIVEGESRKVAERYVDKLEEGRGNGLAKRRLEKIKRIIENGKGLFK